MRALLITLAITSVAGHNPANPQQLPVKVFNLHNGTTQKIVFHVLTSTTDAWTTANAGALGSNKDGTFQCGSSKCYVGYTSGGRTTATGVAPPGKYAFSMSGKKLGLFAATR